MPDYSGLPSTIFRKGETLKARDLQALANAIRRQSMLPGSFQSGALLLQAGQTWEQEDNATLVLACILAEVPAMTGSISGTYPDYDITFTHGFAEEAAIILEATDSGWRAPLVGEYETPRLVAVANISRSILRGSTDKPIFLLGYERTLLIDEEESAELVDAFVPANWDMSSLPGLNGNAQIPFHDGDGAFKLDGASCAEDES